MLSSTRSQKSYSSKRSLSSLAVLLLSVVSSRANSNATRSQSTPGESSRSFACFQTSHELSEAFNAYFQDGSNDTEVASTYGWPIENWCFSHMPNSDEVDELRLTAELNLVIDLSDWDRDCDCQEHHSEEIEKVEESEVNVSEHPLNLFETSTSMRGASSESSSTATATEVSTTNTETGSSSSSSDSQGEMPMIYRLMPIKLLLVLLVLSVIMVIRQLVDFRPRYEGIDPSEDQKIVEFELLQLAEEA